MRRPNPLKGASQTRAHLGVFPTLPQRSASPGHLCWAGVSATGLFTPGFASTHRLPTRGKIGVSAHTCVQARGVGRAGDGTQEAGPVCTHASPEAILEPGPWGCCKAPLAPARSPANARRVPTRGRRCLAGVSSSVSVVCHFYLGKAGPTGYSSLSFSTTARHLPFLSADPWGPAAASSPPAWTGQGVRAGPARTASAAAWDRSAKPSPPGWPSCGQMSHRR